MDYPELKNLLDNLYNTYDFKASFLQDPVEFPHRYQEKKDIETSGFIASAFAYGRVTLLKPVIENVLAIMGDSPADFILNFNPQKDGCRFNGIKYRFNDTNDTIHLVYVLSQMLRRWGTIEACFIEFYDGKLVSSAISGVVNYVFSLDNKEMLGIQSPSKGFKHFFPSPEKGSPCKRMNLFLRWMVRNRDIDFGIWKGIPKNLLIIPLDTHIARISHCLGLTRRKSHDWKMAEEITESLKRLDPEDPLKYDFALCHQGVMGLCRKGICKEMQTLCPVFDFKK